MYIALFICLISVLKILNGAENCDYNYGFVLDESGSVNLQNYQESVDFIIDLVENNIAHSAQLMAVAYGEINDWIYHFADQQLPRGGPGSILDELNKERGNYAEGGYTRTAAAMSAAIGEFELHGYTENNVIILVTDGAANDNPCTQYNILTRLSDANIRVIIVGVGSFNAATNVIQCLADPADIIDIDNFDFGPVIVRLEDGKVICTCDENGIGVLCGTDEDCAKYGECMMCCKGTGKCHKRPEFRDT